MANEHKNKLEEKYVATLIGCAIGDALGMPVEGLKKEKIQDRVGRVTDFMDSVSPYTSRLKAGQYTDDTVLTLAIAESIIEKKGLTQITDDGPIIKIIDKIIASNPQQVADYKSGKDKLFGFFVGQVMKESKGKANPAKVNQLLKDKLS